MKYENIRVHRNDLAVTRTRVGDRTYTAAKTLAMVEELNKDLPEGTDVYGFREHDEFYADAEQIHH